MIASGVDAGVVDEDVERAGSGCDLLGGGCDGLRIVHIQLHDDEPVGRLPRQIMQGLGVGRLSAASEDQRIARSDILTRQLKADAAIRARD